MDFLYFICFGRGKGEETFLESGGQQSPFPLITFSPEKSAHMINDRPHFQISNKEWCSKYLFEHILFPLKILSIPLNCGFLDF